MDQTITLVISDALHRELVKRGASVGKTAEQLALAVLQERFGQGASGAESAADPLLAALGAQGLLSSTLLASSTASGEHEALDVDALETEASDALTRLGKTLADVVER